MKRMNWLVLLLTVGTLAAGKTAQAQVALYGEAAADYLNSGPYTDFLEGGTAGLLVDLAQGWHSRITFSADLQGNFVYNDSKSSLGVPAFTAGEMYDAITIGPRLSMAPHCGVRRSLRRGGGRRKTSQAWRCFPFLGWQCLQMC